MILVSVTPSETGSWKYRVTTDPPGSPISLGRILGEDVILLTVIGAPSLVLDIFVYGHFGLFTQELIWREVGVEFLYTSTRSKWLDALRLYPLKMDLIYILKIVWYRFHIIMTLKIFRILVHLCNGPKEGFRTFSGYFHYPILLIRERKFEKKR